MSDLKKKIEALLALQDEYIQLVEEENPDCLEPLSYYTELLVELKKAVRKNSMKFARAILQNECFQQCLSTPNASLYLPILEFVQMMFRGHKYLASTVLKEVPEIILNTFQEISLHLKYAYESLIETTGQSNTRSRSKLKHDEEEHEEMNALYSKSEAKTIAEVSSTIIKSAIESGDTDGDVICFLVMESPETIEFLSKCSTLMNSREFSRLAMHLVEKEEKIRELQLRTAAAIVIQAFWKSVLQKRKWIKMKSGFIQLQKLFRKKTYNRENELWRNFRASERKFNVELNALKEKRKLQEKIFESIRKTPSSQLNLLFSGEKEGAAKKIQDCWRSHRESTITEPMEGITLHDAKIEQAALTIQVTVRRWLTRRKKKNLAKSQPFLNKPITEERAMKLQQDIDAWQHHHTSPPMTSRLR